MDRRRERLSRLRRAFIGLSVVLDCPSSVATTPMTRSAARRWGESESLWTLWTMPRSCYDGVPLDKISEFHDQRHRRGPACLPRLRGGEEGVPLAEQTGTIQNDIL